MLRSKDKLLVIGRTAAAALLLTAMERPARAQDQQPAAAPPSLVVAADAAPTYARVPVSFRGIGFEPATLKSWDMSADYRAAVYPKCGEDLSFALLVVTSAVDRTVHVEGRVTDYLGTELQKAAFDVPVKAGESASRLVTTKPAQTNLGPFYFRGTWKESAGPLQGTFAAEAGQPNCHLVIKDFELVEYPEPGGPLESSPSAAHRGSMGLLVRLSALIPRTAQATNLPPQALERIPLGLELPGRPVRQGFWAKASAPVKARLHLHDPGIEVNQSTRLDSWTVGPVPIEPGDWRYVEFPMPAYGRPKAERKEYGEANGVADYPPSRSRSRAPRERRYTWTTSMCGHRASRSAA